LDGSMGMVQWRMVVEGLGWFNGNGSMENGGGGSWMVKWELFNGEWEWMVWDSYRGGDV
jgi:hypothetical protein